MQDRQEQGEADGLFGRWRVRLAQALLREPSVVLIDRDADSLCALTVPADQMPASETVN